MTGFVDLQRRSREFMDSDLEDIDVLVSWSDSELSGLPRSKVTNAMHPCLWTNTQSWVICSMLLNMDGEPTAGIEADRERLRHGRRHAGDYSRRRRGQFTSALAMLPGMSSAHCSCTARL